MQNFNFNQALMFSLLMLFFVLLITVVLMAWRIMEHKEKYQSDLAEKENIIRKLYANLGKSFQALKGNPEFTSIIYALLTRISQVKNINSLNNLTVEQFLNTLLSNDNIATEANLIRDTKAYRSLLPIKIENLPYYLPKYVHTFNLSNDNDYYTIKEEIEIKNDFDLKEE